MKIGIDCRMIGSRFTGIGHYIENLIHELSIIDNQSQYHLFMNQPEFNEFQVPNKRFKKILVNCKIYSLQEQIDFAWSLYRHNLDLVHFPHFNAPILYIKKNIITIHDVTLDTHAKNKLKKLAYKISFYINSTKAKKIICVSKFSKKELNKQVRFTKNKSQVVYEGCTFKEASEGKKDNSKNYIFYAGNWKSHKNIEGLITAFEILKSQYKYKGKLLLTGGVSKDHPRPQEMIERSKYKKDISVLGRVSHTKLQHLFKNAKVYVQPSFVEGFGLPVLEAFYNNTPVVCSNTGSLPEVGGKAATYFNPKDTADMAYKINKALRTKTHNTDNMQKQLAKFSFRNMAKRTLKLYKNV
jgi:glycosyltransferase involved in cell wall biosynthesis